ncbi:hypothetical protein F0160_22680 [Paraburkholderia sp. JPY303]|uniref:hypothetical protein n=1 Tax=Paraburkholderia atlantica TaxID=2654982 RepID=UPI00159299A4|nr:hypothetical protein [Paraburkholderia atlantica]NUY33294.1 hypothetical protein [Paraburkholderia atlantica]
MLNPVPLTVLLADRVVNAPVLGVVAPTLALLTVPPVMAGVLIDGLVPNTSAPLPVSSEITPASWADVVAANCARVPLVSAYVVPHEKPDALVYLRALLAVLQLGNATAVGDALDAVTFASTVLAACAARLAGGTPPLSVNVPCTVRLLNVGDG